MENPVRPTPTTEPPRQHLRQLTVIRSIVLAFFWCGFAASFYIERINLPHVPVLSILCVFSALYLLTLVRLRHSRLVTNAEFFIQLLIDVLCLNIIFYFSGGATNPFISYLLVPVCISAATLPWLYTWFITALCVIAYSLLLFFHVALPIFTPDHVQMQSQLNWHILGMWLNFFVSAVLITYFVVKMAHNLRQQQARINQMREDELRNEQVIAVATLAAGAAHEINTPLATMAVLLAELRDEYQFNPALLTDLQLLSRQVNHCANSLKQIVHDASAATMGQKKRQTIKVYCNSILDRWQLMRPAINYAVHFAAEIANQIVTYDSRLDHAIINLLNNAADASPENISLKIFLENDYLVWSITDTGHGITQDVSALIGKSTITTKDTGLGLGMLLSHTTINRYGGSVTQTDNAPQGTVTIIKLPLDSRNQ
ncbi:MAG: HAMP domain-containing histidine kinase [Moraxellaceae bacterium]|jgi:two-component system sensor histidine kinase RegB|nr:MAG: HAMP domain-containing histidine kinase [Moraxellaceae bacterium]